MKRSYFMLLCTILMTTSLFAQHSETRDIGTFTNIHFEGNGNLHLRQGSTPSLEITAKKEQALAAIVTEIYNNTLHIHYKDVDCARWRSFSPSKYAKVDIYLTYTNIQALELEGRIKFHNESSINTDAFVLETSGHVRGDLDVQVQELTVETGGYAKIGLTGTAERFDVDMEGLGKLNAQELKSTHCIAEGEGTVVLCVHAIETLKADIYGLAKMEYTGNPKNMDIDRAGLVRISAVSAGSEERE